MIFYKTKALFEKQLSLYEKKIGIKINSKNVEIAKERLIKFAELMFVEKLKKEFPNMIPAEEIASGSKKIREIYYSINIQRFLFPTQAMKNIHDENLAAGKYVFLGVRASFIEENVEAIRGFLYDLA